MRRTLFSFLLRWLLTIPGLAMMLACAAWAAPKFKVLHMVSGGMFSGVTLDGKGNIFGTTGGGGTYDAGTIFELMPGSRGWTLKIVHNFVNYDGGGGSGGLILDAAGNIYGTTPAGGGPNNGGVVFEMTPGSKGWTYNVLYRFCLQYHCPDGSGSEAGMILDKAGDLYGTTSAGGAYGQGTVFRVMYQSGAWSETILHSFKGTDGSSPYGGLILDNDDKLYGSTVWGGRFSPSCYFGCGVVFALKHDSSGWHETPVFKFNGKDGAAPYIGVTLDGSGNLYGTTRAGGVSGFGTVFKLSRTLNGVWKHELVYEFRKPENGKFPSGGLMIDKAGNLYGSTSNGGDPSCSSGCGVIYKLKPTTARRWEYIVMHKFTGRDGGYPDGVASDDKGNLYGSAFNVVFKITP
jgi:uncharacterized repeat protein (TIGR03803 family)